MINNIHSKMVQICEENILDLETDLINTFPGD